LLPLLALAVGCTGREVELLQPAPDENDHGRAALLAAVEEHAALPPSPAAYRAFTTKVDALRPRFNAEVSDHAGLYVAFFALPVLEAQLERPRPEQLEALALTVLPAAFGVQPRPQETVRDYLLRVCGREQPLDCKDWVPEGWPVMLLARARRELKHKAGEALSTCTICGDESRYEQMLAHFSELVAKEDAHAKLMEDEYVPSAWPTAGEHADAWAGAPLFAIDGDGNARLGDETLPPGSWRLALRGARAGGNTTLGVHLRPRDRLKTLRTVAADAAAAGYTELALQVRRHGFPYPLAQYRISLRAGRRVDVRDTDTIQILARALDALAARGAIGRL
jgi:hypothetical protein